MIVGALPDLVFLDGAVAVNRSLTANSAWPRSSTRLWTTMHAGVV